MASRAHGIVLAILIVVIAFTPVVKIGNLPPLRADDFLVVILFLVAWEWASSRGTGWWFSPGKSAIGLLYLGLMMVTIVSYLAGLEAGRYQLVINDALYTPATDFRLFMTFVICATARPDRRGWNWIIWSLLVCGIVEVAVLGLQFYDLGNFRRLSTEFWGGWEKLVAAIEAGRATTVRATGSLGNTNASSAFVGMCLGAALSTLLYGRGLFRRLVVPMGALAGAMICFFLWTESRGATIATLGSLALAVFLGIIVIPWMGGRHRWGAVALMLLVVGVGLVLVAKIESLPIPNRMKSIFRMGEHGEGGIGRGMYVRTRMWQERASEVAEQANPLTGFGPSKFIGRVVDNDYVSVYYRLGLLGLLIFIPLKFLVSVKTISNIFRSRDSDSLKVAMMLFCMNAVILVYAITDEVSKGDKMGLFVAMTAGLTCALGAQLRKSRLADQDYPEPFPVDMPPAEGGSLAV
ncbi:MAG: hypothetical protein GWP05_00785 [Anaerolineaceae bacterium]|nr:hypothetical protein [Anaerolineaceae bacterium]